MGVIEEVKQRTDIIEIASQYTTLTKSGRNFKAICPFHSEKHPSFFIYPEQQSWHCFGACNTGGDVFSLIMKKEGLDFGEVLRRTAERAGVIVPSRAYQSSDKDKNERLYRINQLATDYFHQQLVESLTSKKAREYVAKRGLSEESINAFKLGYSPNSWDSLKQYLNERGFTETELITAGLIIETESAASHDRFRNRLMFPINDIKGRTIGFGARVLDDSIPKYTNSPDTPLFYKSSCLYGIDLAREVIRHQDKAVIVEGYMDVIAAHDNGFANVIASMGTSITEKQVKVLKKLTKNIILALDADTAGEEAVLRGIFFENNLGSEVKVALLPSGRDPDEVIRESKGSWQKLIIEAIPVMDYTFSHITAGLDLNTAQGKSLAVDKLLPLITQISNLVRQAHYMQKLARLVNISQNRLEMVIESNRINRSKSRLMIKGETSAATVDSEPFLSNQREEYCLELLLQHPELKAASSSIMPDYFESSENREIFNAYQLTENISSIKDKLDDSIWEHIDRLITKKLTSDKLEERLADCIQLLKRDYFRNLERKKEVILSSEAAIGGSSAELKKLKEQGIESSFQLRDIDIQRSRGGQQQRRNV
ncbi:MAG: DNA primase [Dehalococcoidia bacterium]|nr:MAG: DNA primase [Dehalococcoidia bacterium]